MADDEQTQRRAPSDGRSEQNARAMIDAAYRGDADAVRRALGDDPALTTASDDWAKTALHWAAEADRAEVATILLDAGADPEAVTSWGMTPLQWAANMGSRAVGDLLIGRGGTIDLWSAAGLGLVSELRRILDELGRGTIAIPTIVVEDRLEGTYRSSRDIADRTRMIDDAFSIACRNGHVEAARLLRDAGADVNARGFRGGTGLHWAAYNGHADVVRFLIDDRADRTLRDEKHDGTPADWAVHGGQPEIAAMLAV